jgi:inner membrane protein YidH
MKADDKQVVIQHLANEQTYLAWLRTGLEVMAFGFVAIKFSLFASQVMGIVLVGVGILMTLLAYFRYQKTVKQLRKGQYEYSSVLLTVTATAILIVSAILLFCLVEAYIETGSAQGNPLKEKEKAFAEKIFRPILPGLRENELSSLR